MYPTSCQPCSGTLCQVHLAMPRPRVRKLSKGTRNSVRHGMNLRFSKGWDGSLVGLGQCNESKPQFQPCMQHDALIWQSYFPSKD